MVPDKINKDKDFSWATSSSKKGLLQNLRKTEVLAAPFFLSFSGAFALPQNAEKGQNQCAFIGWAPRSSIPRGAYFRQIGDLSKKKAVT